MSGGPGRILALDLGQARIGVALSDPLGITAQPAGVLRRSSFRKDVEAIRALVAGHAVERVVLGHPVLLSGESGRRAVEAERWASSLARELPGISVDLWDERLTTRQAERAMIDGGVRRARRREKVDTIAAVLILQSYLDAHAPPRAT